MSNGVIKVRRVSTAAFAVLALLGGIWAMLGVGAAPVSAVVGANEQINFQGRLFNAQGAVVPDGYYNIEFKIYQDGDGQSIGNTTGTPAGVLKWTESHLNSAGKGVLVKNGYMSVELGSVNAFGSQIDWNQSVLWLSMNIGSTNATCTPFANCMPDGEMVPMKRLSATPYALNAAKLGGRTANDFLQNTTNLQQANIAIQSIASSNVGMLVQGATAQTADLMQIKAEGVSTPLLAVGADGHLTVQTTADTSPALSVKSSTSANLLTVRSSGGSAKVGIGNDASSGYALDVTGDINSSDRYRINGQTTLTSSALTFSAASGAIIQAAANQSITMVGGDATTLDANGGNVTVYGGSGNGIGVRGLVNLGPAAFASGTQVPCATSCTIDQSLVDTYGTVIVSATASDIDITLPAPTVKTAGRTIYVATSSTSLDFNLHTNTGLNQIDVAMRKNTTSTMIWNGLAWTPGGASNATTLQATYNNGSNPATTPEIKLDSIRGTIDIQDADVSIGADLLNIRSSNANGLGTVLFGVGDTGRVTIQGTTDQSSAFRVLDSNGNYQLNVNSSNGYIINNSISNTGNQITNPGFEAGGMLSGGEEGWFGPAVASIVNNDANSGNYALAVGANSSSIDVFGGTYFEVVPGDSLYLQAYIKNSAGGSATNGGIRIYWYNKDKQVIGASANFGSGAGTSYELRKLSAVAPTGTQYARISAAVAISASTGTYYFDDFYLRRNIEVADYTFRNAANSTNAFKIQSASSAQTLFTADTTNNRLKIGDNLGTDTATTLLVLDSSVADPSTSLINGGLFYRSDTNSLKAIIGGSVVDICTTAVTCTGYSASAGSSIQLQSGSPGTKQIGNFNISGTGILTKLQTENNTAGSSQNLSILTGNATGGVSGNITIDTGTASATRGSITIGTGNVGVTMGGTLAIQGSNTLTLGKASTNSGSILFHSAAGSNTVTLRGPASAGTSYSLTLPSNLGAAGECMKTDAGGNIYFQGCGVGVNYNLQDAYNNSSTPADISLSDGKNLTFTAMDTAGTDPSILFNLNCGASCTQLNGNGRFAVRNGLTDIFTVSPNGAGITLNGKTQIGSSAHNDGVMTLFQLDSFNGSDTDEGACSTTVNQGAIYYNTSMGSLRSCINGAWSDVSNPDTLGLLSFGIVPSSGNRPYDLPSLIDKGSSGPCKVSYMDANTVHVEPCVAYSNGRRLTVTGGNLDINQAVAPHTNLTGTARWGHVCLHPSTGQVYFTSTTGATDATSDMPDSNAQFDAASPIVCLADVQATTAGGIIDNIYDTRTFTSAMKEAVNLSTATELGMLVDAGTGGAMTPAVSASAKLYGTVVATNGQTSAGAPNAIVTTVGPAWVKVNAGTAGQFVKTSTTNGYGNTTISIPNNSFYYSVGNTRTSFDTTCTNSTNCSGSLYVNFIVR